MRDGRTVVLVPKFRGRWLSWVRPLLTRPDFRVKLDDEGSFVWEQCDGRSTVLEIADRLHGRLGGDPAEVRARVARFVKRLVRDQLLTFDHPGDEP
ncbi:MAG: PqqD family protein [Gemmatimonadetes bacterium]|nr:PqqD family protein [Gemmatimonadota bacterium]